MLEHVKMNWLHSAQSSAWLRAFLSPRYQVLPEGTQKPSGAKVFANVVAQSVEGVRERMTVGALVSLIKTDGRQSTHGDR